jgi:hypothetical protein
VCFFTPWRSFGFFMRIAVRLRGGVEKSLGKRMHVHLHTCTFPHRYAHGPAAPFAPLVALFIRHGCIHTYNSTFTHTLCI